MMLRTPICDLFGIRHPIVLAGMGGVSMHKLVAAVSNAGGLGVIGAATLDANGLRREIRLTRELTDKPFAVDLLAPIPDMIRPQMQVVFEENIKIFVAGLAVPQEFIIEMHERGMIVVVMIGKVRHAIKSAQAGADVVAAQGTEAGGHTGEIGALALVPQVVDAVKIPVLAAGGIVDGRQLVAALALGAQGVVVGTRFIATPEAQAAPKYREAIVQSGEADTVRTRCYTGKPARTIRNSYNESWERRANEIQPFPMQVMTSVREGVMDYMGNQGDANPERCFMPAGQGMGLIHEIKPAAEVMADIIREAEGVLRGRMFAADRAVEAR
ncbi:MAG: nitronate monooxygenase [Deltaproteobacteria bacterium]|nr:nitronate monooxygenase [Deltaproteobacteria bacterium]MBI3388433.1 nitronate monooxygenase [Deltaproteobacteria bacterium]